MKKTQRFNYLVIGSLSLSRKNVKKLSCEEVYAEAKEEFIDYFFTKSWFIAESDYKLRMIQLIAFKFGAVWDIESNHLKHKDANNQPFLGVDDIISTKDERMVGIERVQNKLIYSDEIVFRQGWYRHPHIDNGRYIDIDVIMERYINLLHLKVLCNEEKGVEL